MDGSVVQSAVMLQTMITWMFMIAVVLYCLPPAIRKLVECLRIVHLAAQEFTKDPPTSGPSIEEGDLDPKLIAEELVGARRRR